MKDKDELSIRKEGKLDYLNPGYALEQVLKTFSIGETFSSKDLLNKLKQLYPDYEDELLKKSVSRMKRYKESFLYKGLEHRVGFWEVIDELHPKASKKYFNYDNLEGMRIGKLTVKNKVSYKRWLCICSCGKEVEIYQSELVSKKLTSCGCGAERIEKNTTHGMSKTRLYRIWHGIKTRCNNPGHSDYKSYGAKGIRICDEWKDFVKFKEWSLQNGYQDTLSIDRINVNGNYCPENCRWVDMKTQSNNKTSNVFITYKGETKTMKQWSQDLGINYGTLKTRIYSGWTIDKCFEKK